MNLDRQPYIVSPSTVPIVPIVLVLVLQGWRRRSLVRCVTTACTRVDFRLEGGVAFGGIPESGAQ